MLEVLQFIFSDFWHFTGTLILLYVLRNGTPLGLAVRPTKKTDGQ